MTAAYDHLLDSIASTVADYRDGEIAPITKDHVARWIHQFDPPVRLAMLQELDHVLKTTYFSRAELKKWLGTLATHRDLVGASPDEFWSSVSILRLQSRGESQKEICGLLEETIRSTFNVSLGAMASSSGPFIYLDDFIFTGNTAIADLKKWIVSSAPSEIRLDVLVIAVHTYGGYYVEKQLKKVASEAGKTLHLRFWRIGEFEDRKTYVDATEVFRPTRANGDPDVELYVAQLKYPPVLRSPGSMPTTGVFHAPETRDVLEWELLRAGARLRARCANPKPSMRPLGFATLHTLGFGATVLTFRNCPNNAPLALWWGEPDAADGPLAWYPLFPRRVPGSTVVSKASQATATPQPPPPSKVTRTPFYDFHEGPNDGLSAWASDAVAAVHLVVAGLDFDASRGVVRIECDEGWTEVASLDELRSHLEAAYDEAWYASVPFEGGEAAFESNDAEGAIDDALARLSGDLESLGWSV